MILTLEDYHRVYVIWDEYKGRFLDLSGTVRLTDDSAYSYRWVNVRIVELGSQNTVASKRLEAHKTFDSSITDWELRMDLKTYFGTVPDYRKIRFYVEVNIQNAQGINEAHFRLNRGEFNG